MSRPVRFASRLLVALALIVQIFAPVGAGAAMMRMTFDPAAGAQICVHDEDGADLSGDTDHGLARHGEACGLCQLVAAGGHAPPVFVQIPVDVPPATAIVAWRLVVEAVVAERHLDQIRGRAPPALS